MSACRDLLEVAKSQLTIFRSRDEHDADMLVTGEMHRMSFPRLEEEEEMQE